MPKDKSDKPSKPDKVKSSKKKEAKAAAAAAEAAAEPAPVASGSTSPPPAPEPTATASDSTTTTSAAVEEAAEPVEDDPNLLTIDTTLPAPLSKAAIRKAKAKGLPPPAPVPSSSVPAVVLGEDGEEVKPVKAPKEPKVEKFSIWIGNLAFKTTEQQVRDFLASALKKQRKWGAAGEDQPEGEALDDDEETEEKEATITRINLPKTGSGGKWGANKGSVQPDRAQPTRTRRAQLTARCNLKCAHQVRVR